MDRRQDLEVQQAPAVPFAPPTMAWALHLAGEQANAMATETGTTGIPAVASAEGANGCAYLAKEMKWGGLSGFGDPQALTAEEGVRKFPRPSWP